MKKAVVIVLAAGILSAAAYSLYASGLNSEIKAEGLMTAKTSEQDVNLDDQNDSDGENKAMNSAPDASPEDSDEDTGTRLNGLEPSEKTSVETWLQGDFATDNYGNTYDYVLACNNGYGEYNEVKYDLEGKYAELTGTFYITKASVKSAGNFESGKPEIRIYGDEKLLYTKKGCTSKDKPEDFVVDLSGVKSLMIVFDGAYFNEGFGFKRPLIVIGKPTLWEKPRNGASGNNTPGGTSDKGDQGKQGVRTRLTDLDPFGKTSVETWLPESFTTDNYGNSYDYVLACNNGYGSYNEVEYYLGGKYTELTGTFYITKASLNSVGNFESDKPEIRIYGDDNLLHTKQGCTSKDKPEEFLVDLTGVEFLKIVFDGACFIEGSGFERPLIVIGEPVLWEKIVP